MYKCFNSFQTRSLHKLIKQENDKSTLTILSNNIEKVFQLQVKNKEFLSNGQTIAVLDEDLYKTQTGGIICYDIDETKSNKKRRSTKKVFSGFLYWIPEETYQLKNIFNLSAVKVKNGTFIKAKTEILPNIFSTLIFSSFHSSNFEISRQNNHQIQNHSSDLP